MTCWEISWRIFNAKTEASICLLHRLLLLIYKSDYAKGSNYLTSPSIKSNIKVWHDITNGFCSSKTGWKVSKYMYFLISGNNWSAAPEGVETIKYQNTSLNTSCNASPQSRMKISENVDCNQRWFPCKTTNNLWLTLIVIGSLSDKVIELLFLSDLQISA